MRGVWISAQTLGGMPSLQAKLSLTRPDDSVDREDVRSLQVYGLLRVQLLKDDF